MYAKCFAGSASESRIAGELGLSRNTVAGYHRWARQHGLLTGELPDLATLLHPPEPAQPRPDQPGTAPRLPSRLGTSFTGWTT
jgi:hypothetical protein